MTEQLVIPGLQRQRPQNPPTPDDLKRQGIEQALANEREKTRQLAFAMVEIVADENHEFTADDIADAWERSGVSFHHPNVAGGVIRTALKAGVMVRTGQYVASKRLSRKASMVPVYRAGEIAP